MEIIERGAREGNLRGLKLMHRDLVSDLKDRFEEDEAHRVAFEAIMSERFGSGAGTLPAVDWPAAAAILERGAIRDDDEYVLLRSIYDHHRPAGEMGGLDEDEVATLIGRWEAALDRDGGEP
ncbi:MAG: hypothetical protein OEZ65_10965 [Gemmatimonadota bacterium]|nr:hypothetical protein [Gemmatimonadota bacterium]